MPMRAGAEICGAYTGGRRSRQRPAFVHICTHLHTGYPLSYHTRLQKATAFCGAARERPAGPPRRPSRNPGMQGPAQGRRPCRPPMPGAACGVPRHRHAAQWKRGRKREAGSAGSPAPTFSLPRAFRPFFTFFFPGRYLLLGRKGLARTAKRPSGDGQGRRSGAGGKEAGRLARPVPAGKGGSAAGRREAKGIRRRARPREIVR